jgi:hypothetical protein
MARSPGRRLLAPYYHLGRRMYAMRRSGIPFARPANHSVGVWVGARAGQTGCLRLPSQAHKPAGHFGEKALLAAARTDLQS